MGSALAILLFYPLERARVELQTNADGATTSAGHANSGPDGGTDDGIPSTLPGPSSRATVAEGGEPLEFRARDEDLSNCARAGSRMMEVMHDEAHAAPDSSTGSFELVPSIEASDAASLGTLSCDGGGYDNDEISGGSSIEYARQHEPSNLDSTSNLVCIGATTHDGEIEPLGSAVGPDFVPTQPRETIAQCLLRLHAAKSLYKGASHMVTTMMVSNAVYFYSLQVIRRRLSSSRRYHGNDGRNFKGLQLYFLHRISNTSSMMNSLIASTLAGCINVVLTNPLWVASLRAMEVDGTQRHENVWNVMYNIAQNEGVSQLWNGTHTSLMLVSNPIIQHFAYEQMRVWLLKRCRKRFFLGSKYGGSSRNGHGGGGGGNCMSSKPASLSPVEAFLCGALAKTLATVLTYPLQLAQTLLRLQKKAVDASSSTVANNAGRLIETHYRGTYDCLCKQFFSGGIRALFHGMNAKMLQTVLTAAFTFMTYEQTLIFVGRMYDFLVVSEATY